MWDHSPLQRCAGGNVTTAGAVAVHARGAVDDIYISGHVIFFDRWVDANKTEYFAFESTETEQQTNACRAQHGALTRSMCFNHHVKKERNKTIDRWSKENCTDEKYGFVDGGAHRLSADLVCPSSEQ